MYERRYEPLLERRMYLVRLLRHGGLAAAVVVISLGLGTVGYHLAADLPWVDSLLNAAMILTGMGPVDALHTTVAKLWATGYAIFSGVIFLAVAGVLIAPVLHRFLHHFHLEESEKPRKKK